MIQPIRMNTTFPTLRIAVTHPRVAIDVREALADVGHKPMGRFMREEAERAQAAGVEAIGGIAREGDRLAQVEVSNNAIVEIAREKWQDHRELNVDVAPKHRVTVELESGHAETTFTPGQVNVDLPHLRGTGRNIDIRV